MIKLRPLILAVVMITGLSVDSHAVFLEITSGDWLGIVEFPHSGPEFADLENQEELGAAIETQVKQARTAFSALMGGESQDLEYLSANYESFFKEARFSVSHTGVDAFKLKGLPVYYALIFLWNLEDLMPGEKPETRGGRLALALQNYFHAAAPGTTDQERANLLSFSELQGNLLQRVNQTQLMCSEGTMAITLAAARGFPDVLRFLLKTRLPLVGFQSSGQPLLCALAEKKECAVRLLFDYDPSWVSAKGPQNVTPLHLLAAHGYLDLIQQVFKPDSAWYRLRESRKSSLLWQKDEKGALPLHYAASLPTDDLALYLLSLAPETRLSRLSSDQNLAHGAARRGHLRLLKEIFKESTDGIKAKGKNQETVLHQAVVGGNPEVVRFVVSLDRSLLKELGRVGESVQQAGEKGFSPFEYAIVQDNLGVLQVFLDSGVDPHEFLAPKSKKQNALHCAAFVGAKDSVKFFLDLGVNPDLRDQMGLLPEDLADEDILRVFHDWRVSHRGVFPGELRGVPPVATEFPNLRRYAEAFERCSDEAERDLKLFERLQYLKVSEQKALVDEAKARVSRVGKGDLLLDLAGAVLRFEEILEAEGLLDGLVRQIDLGKKKKKITSTEIEAALTQGDAIIAKITYAWPKRLSWIFEMSRRRSEWVSDSRSETPKSRADSLESLGHDLIAFRPAPLRVGTPAPLSPKDLINLGETLTPELMSLDFLMVWASLPYEGRERVYERLYPEFKKVWDQRLLESFGYSLLLDGFRGILEERTMDVRALLADLRMASETLSEIQIASYVLASDHKDLNSLKSKLRESLGDLKSRASSGVSGVSLTGEVEVDQSGRDDAAEDVLPLVSPELWAQSERELTQALRDRGFREFFKKILMPNKVEVASVLGRDFSEMKSQLLAHIRKCPTRFKIREGQSGQGFILVDRFAGALGYEVKAVGCHAAHGRTRSDYGIGWNILTDLRKFFEQARMTLDRIDSAESASRLETAGADEEIL